MSAENLQDLPPNLTRLWIPGKIQNDHWQHLPKSITIFDNQVLSSDRFYVHLPRDLKKLMVVDSLSCTRTDVSSQYFEHLPQSITDLSLKGHKLLGSAADQKILPLPKTITRLTLHNVMPWLTLRLAENLPPYLDYFKIVSNDNNTSLAEGFVQSLPRTLRELMLVNIIMLDHYIPHLTPNLQILTIEDFNSLLSDQSVVHFPRTLKRLSLIGAKLHTDESMKDMPRGLKTLSMPDNNALTEACLCDIPKFLLHLNVSQCEGLQQSNMRKPPGQYPHYPHR